MKRIEIYTSRMKSGVIFLGSLAFVALGLWLLTEADNINGWMIKNPFITKGVGIASILFFGFGLLVAIKGLIKPELALIIDPKGININPKRSETEFINWVEITFLEEIKIQSTRIIIIGVNNPKYWLDKETNPVRKKLMKFNINSYDSPFNISATGLNIKADELNQTLNKFFEKYKNEAQHVATTNAVASQ